MYRKFPTTITMLCGLIGLVFISLALPANSQEKVYTFGVVPQFDARQIKSIWQPILDAVSHQTGLHIELVGSANIQIFEKQFLEGEFDFAYMNPYHLIKAQQAQGYRPFLRDVGRTLYGIIVVRNDSPIANVTDLQGKTVAFPAPNALGAALIPRAEFGEVYNMQIIPKYVRSHDSVYLNVLLGQADAGGGVQKTFAKQPDNVRNALKIIYETQKLAPHPVAAHPRVPQVIIDQITEAFLAFGATPEGRALLQEVPINQIGKATQQDYEPLKNLGLEKYYVDVE